VWDTRAIGTVPLSLAFAAGGLTVINPCGFPLLPAYLSIYLGAEEHQLPAAPTRILEGLVIGTLVALGCLGFFAVVGLPLSLGLSAVADAVPWLGLVAGVLLAVLGVMIVLGAQVRLRLHLPIGIRRERRYSSMVMFGVAYGAASLGCTLPIYLSLVGASVGAGKAAVFLAYGAGMALVLMALAVTVACAREGLARRLRPALPHVGRVSGALLIASGAYLVYYWARIRFGDQVTLANDPIVGFATRYSAELQSFAERHGAPLVIVASVIVGLALISALSRRARRHASASAPLVRR
jgi:cytochrome c-type biogenesis protein